MVDQTRALWRELEEAQYVRSRTIDVINRLDVLIAAAQAQLVPGSLPVSKILTVGAAAKLAHVSEESVRDWCAIELQRHGANGWAHRPGKRGRWLIDRSGFLGFIGRATALDDQG